MVPSLERAVGMKGSLLHRLGNRSRSKRFKLVMKVIFLDIDGVLNSASTPNPRKFPYIVDDRLLARFKELVRRTG